MLVVEVPINKCFLISLGFSLAGTPRRFEIPSSQRLIRITKRWCADVINGLIVG